MSTERVRLLVDVKACAKMTAEYTATMWAILGYGFGGYSCGWLLSGVFWVSVNQQRFRVWPAGS